MTPLFEFFEIISEELSTQPSRVITRDDLQVNKEVSSLLDDLKAEMQGASAEDAMHKAVEALRVHFQEKSSRLPFSFDPTTGRFEATDPDFLSFVNIMGSIRSIGKKSMIFECTVADRLSQRTTGSIHRVGHPRRRKKGKKAFNKHLRQLGFHRPVLLGQEKDGGFDIMWMLPLAAIPHRPIVSVQCKNGEFSFEAADTSVGAGLRSFSQHGGLTTSIHVPCVLFNDYIQSKALPRKQLNFVPLGLTDLAKVDPMIHVELL